MNYVNKEGGKINQNQREKVKTLASRTSVHKMIKR